MSKILNKVWPTVAFTLLSTGAANAVCSQIPLNVKDASGNTVAMSSGSANDGACKTYIDADTASVLYGILAQINTAALASIPAGNNLIGQVQATTGTATLGNVIVTSVLPAGTNIIGYVSGDPCMQKTKTNLAISQNTTSSQQLVALNAGSAIYVCSMFLMSNTTNSITFSNGTGTNCANGSTALMGSLTLGTSMAFPANGGFVLGNGLGTIMTVAAGQEVCMLTQTGIIAGNLTYVQI